MVTHDGRAEPPYGRSRPWPAVSRTSSPQSIWGWTSTATRSRWGSSPQTSRSPRSTGFPTTSRRCAGSSPASVTPPAASLRRGRPHRVRARPAACPRGRRLPGGRAVADPTAPGGPGQDRYQGLPPAHCGCTAPASWSPSASPPSPRKRFGTRAAPAPTWSPTAPARGTGWASSCCATPRAWRGGASAWTHAHERWLLGQRFDEPALAATSAHDRAVRPGRDAQLDAVEADLAGWYDRPPFGWQVARLAAYRGVAQLGASRWPPRSPGWRRFPRASTFMGFCGLVPSELLQRPADLARTADQGRQRPPARAAGRVGLVLPAPPRGRRPDRPPPAGPGPHLVARAWAAQLRLCGRFAPAPPPARPPRTWSWPRSPASSPGSCGPR